MSILKEEIPKVFADQVAYFRSGATRSYDFRKKMIKALRQSIKANEEEILTAMHSDLHKPRFEAYSSEIGFMYAEISHTLHWLKEWMRPKRVSTPLVSLPSSSHVHSVPKGQVLILSPWNYPFQLLMNPLLAALAAGNTVMLKLPRQTPATAALVDKMMTEIFPRELVCCLDIEDENVIPHLIEQQDFHHVFFTGSTRVGKLIYAAAAKKLIDVTLELGGKSPVIVDKDADLKIAARRIIWGKCFNAGQTCIAPDHVWVHASVKKEFTDLLVKEAKRTMEGYGFEKDYSYMIHDAHFSAMEDKLKGAKVIYESGKDTAKRYFGLCIVDEPAMDSKLMQEEIFGPILPLLSWNNEEELIQKLDQNPEPLSFYLFTKNKKLEERLVQEISFGSGCLNDCLVQFANTELPFGGVGKSGIGRCHGALGFEAFSFKKSFMRNNTWIDIPVRYVPYTTWKNKVLKLLMR